MIAGKAATATALPLPTRELNPDCSHIESDTGSLLERAKLVALAKEVGGEMSGDGDAILPPLQSTHTQSMARQARLQSVFIKQDIAQTAKATGIPLAALSAYIPKFTVM